MKKMEWHVVCQGDVTVQEGNHFIISAAVQHSAHVHAVSSMMKLVASCYSFVVAVRFGRISYVVNGQSSQKKKKTN